MLDWATMTQFYPRLASKGLDTAKKYAANARNPYTLADIQI